MPLAAFPHNHCRINRQWWERNESCPNDYHQSSERISAQQAIEPATSCSQVCNTTEWAMGLGSNIWKRGLMKSIVEQGENNLFKSIHFKLKLNIVTNIFSFFLNVFYSHNSFHHLSFANALNLSWSKLLLFGRVNPFPKNKCYTSKVYRWQFLIW